MKEWLMDKKRLEVEVVFKAPIKKQKA